MFTLLVYTILIISSVTACTPLQKYFQTPTELNFSGYFDLQKASTNAYIVKHSNFNIGPLRVIVLPNARQTRLLWLPGAAAACSLRHICPVEFSDPDVDIHQYSQYKTPSCTPSGTFTFCWIHQRILAKILNLQINKYKQQFLNCR